MVTFPSATKLTYAYHFSYWNCWRSFNTLRKCWDSGVIKAHACFVLRTKCFHDFSFDESSESSSFLAVAFCHVPGLYFSNFNRGGLTLWGKPRAGNR